jgi:hypothetical protein
MRASLLAALLAVSFAPTLGAQVEPDARWSTLHTAHFRVHFTPELEAAARRAAVNAEEAYAALAAELVPPRGTIDLVVADNVDFTNGFATVFPTNRIVVFSHPPVDAQTLRFYDDWSALVVTHELTHIFHLDRARGWWRLAQRLVGRNPAVMPNLYTPAWLTEGLAVYYESRLTGSGRLAGPQHRIYARAAAIEGRLPTLGQLSQATSRFPSGQGAYTYGSLLIEFLARTRGDTRVRDFIERSSGQLFPFLLDRAARRSFGVSFSRASREWRDSVSRETHDAGPPLPGWRELTGHGWFAFHPRWMDTASLIYAGNTGRSTAAAYRVDSDGRDRRLGRRNDVDPNVPRTDGSIVFSQLEYTSPFDIRSDLWVERGGRQRRLTRGARLAQPDVRRDGLIVAVEGLPAATRLALVRSDGSHVLPLTTGSPDEQWTEPRWSPDGTRIAAARWLRGGINEIVILDTLGAVRRLVARSRAVLANPSWSPDGETLLFSSDESGAMQLYAAVLVRDEGAPESVRLSDTPTGLFMPQLSPDGRSLAAVHFRADGFHIGIAPFDMATIGARPPAPAARPARAPLAPALSDSSRARRYSPWRGLVPRYWFPVVEYDAFHGVSAGGFTSADDVIGRHSYSAVATWNFRGEEARASLAYRYAGLGTPFLDVTLDQDWSGRGFFPDLGSGTDVELRRRSRVAGLAGTFVRPRMRTYGWASVGGEFQRREYRAWPDSFTSRLDPSFRQRYDDASLILAAGWTNTQRPIVSFSPEDGVAISASARERWLLPHYGAARTASAVGSLAGFKSVDLPGYAHHVLAAQVNAGWSDRDAFDDFDVGGTSGSSLAVLPGVTLGGSRRTFGVRGFEAGARSGTRALAGSLEYRAPLFMPSRGIALLPVFFNRTSLTIFADAGTAWCPAGTRVCPPAGRPREWLASAGGELVLDAAFPYDTPLRLRFGVAAPIVDHSLFAAAPPASAYVTFGTSF